MNLEDFLVFGLVGTVVVLLVTRKQQAAAPYVSIPGMPVGSSGSVTCSPGMQFATDQKAMYCCPQGQTVPDANCQWRGWVPGWEPVITGPIVNVGAISCDVNGNCVTSGPAPPTQTSYIDGNGKLVQCGPNEVVMRCGFAGTPCCNTIGTIPPG